jgi:hypothetical protein
MAGFLMTHIKMEEDLQKKAYYLFCRKFIDLFATNPKSLAAVVEVFARHLTENYKHELYILL